MKWAFGIKQKMGAALVLGLTFLLFFLKNSMDRNHLLEINNSFSSVYEDRLLVESYIFRLSELLHHKKILINNYAPNDAEHTRSQMKQQNISIQGLLNDYERTKLTDQEAHFYGHFKKSVTQVFGLEQDYLNFQHNEKQTASIRLALLDEFKRITEHLHELSLIQLSEAKNLKDESGKILAGSNLLSELEFAMLIFVALLIQVLIFASHSTRISKQIPHHRLN